MKPSIQYHDLGLRIAFAVAGAYIVTQYGGNQSLLQLLLTKDFYIEFFVTLAITFLVIQLIYVATTILDKRYGWHSRPLWRIPLQILLGVAVPTLVTFLIAAFYFSLYDRNILETNYHLYALPFIVALISIFNLYYYIRYLLAERSYYRQLSLQQTASYPEGGDDPAASDNTEEGGLYTARTPTRSVPIPISDIAYFYRSSGHVYLRRFSGQDLLLSQSLDAIAPQLDELRFFRVSRRLIAQRSAISDYERIDDGKLALILQPAFRQDVTVSRLQATDFKGWYGR